MTKEPEKFATYLLIPGAPPDGLTPDQWAQQATVIVEQLETLAGLLAKVIQETAPILMEGPVRVLVGGIGAVLQQTYESGQRMLAANGVQVLDMRTEMMNVAREKLSQPGLPQEVRDTLLAMLAEAINEPDADWPGVIGG